MALDLAGLTTNLQSMLGGQTSTTSAATAMSNAIATFAATGQSNGVPCIVPGSATSALRAALDSQFQVVPGSPGGAAGGIASALDTFWLATTFIAMIAPPVSGGGAALSSALSAIFNIVGGTAASKASDIANAIKTHANAVIVTFPPSNPFPVV